MAIQLIQYGVPLPMWPTTVSSAPSTASSVYVLTSAAHQIAYSYRAGVTKSLRYVYLLTGTVTTGDTVDVRIETVDTTNGQPTGTLWAANTNAALVVNSADDNVFLLAGALTADASLTAGDQFALVVANGAGGGNMQFANYADQASRFPRGWTYNGTTWTSRIQPLIGFLGYSDGTWEPMWGVLDQGPVTTKTFSTSGPTTRHGNNYTFPFPVRVSGAWFWLTSTGGDVVINLYDTDGTTVLATSGTIDKDFMGSSVEGICYAPFTAPVTLGATGPYRLVYAPTTTSTVTGYEFTVPAAAVMDAFPGGQAVYAAEYISGSWTDTVTKRAYLGLFLNGFDDGVSAGGGGAFAFFG
jgi:hypothetical protein